MPHAPLRHLVASLLAAGAGRGVRRERENHKNCFLAFHRLNVLATLNVTFLSTNHIENVMRISRGVICKVCRWDPKTGQLTRWMGVALLRAQKGFKRVKGHKELEQLATALGRAAEILTF